MVRNEPLNALPPDLVIALTMPPAKRPNSADTPAVEIVVSCSASSMNSGSDVRRTLSCATTPLTRIRFSEVMAPGDRDLLVAGVRVARAGAERARRQRDRLIEPAVERQLVDELLLQRRRRRDARREAPRSRARSP